MAQRGAERLLMLMPDLSDLVQSLFSVFRKMKRMLAPIIRAWFPLNESAAF